MKPLSFPTDLELRIRYLENPTHQGRGFLKVDWIWLIGLGVVGPLLLILWGWLK